MTVLIAKLVKQALYDEQTKRQWVRGMAGKDGVLIEFSGFLYELPKILKTVEYKLIGEWERTRGGSRKFCVTRYEKIGKVNFTKKPVRSII